MKRNVTLDIIRLYAACLVVMIHAYDSSMGNIAGYILNGMTGQAVPFFFILSGYFFSGKKIYEQNNKYIIYTLKIYMIWQLLWGAWSISIYAKLYADRSVLYIIGVLLRRIFLAGNGVYWYLLVLAEALWILKLFYKKKWMPYLYVISLIGGIWGVLYDLGIEIWKLNSACYFVFSWSNNVVMKGIPFVTIGYLFRKYKESKNILVPSIICYMLLSILSLSYGAEMSRFSPWTGLLAILLFGIGVSYVSNMNEEKARECRNLSSVIYCMHTVFLYFEQSFCPFMIRTGYWNYLLVVTLCILCYFIAKKMNNKYIDWLFMFSR